MTDPLLISRSVSPAPASPLAATKMRKDARVWYIAVSCLVCLAVGGAVIEAFYRGGWSDEYDTVYYANTGIPLGAAFTKLWPIDTNPPFFYFSARLWSELTGPTLFARRLINAIPLAFFLAWLIYAAYRRPAHRPFLSVLALLAVSSDFFIWYFPEYRGYFFQFAAALVFVGAASLSYLDGDKTPDPFQLVALVVLITFHEITAFYTLCLLAPLLLVDLFRRNYLRVLCLVAAAFAGICLLLPFIWMQHHNVMFVLGEVAWIPHTSTIGASGRLVGFLFLDTGTNIAACLAAGVILFIPAYRADKSKASLILLIAGAACAATLVILLINRHVPLIIPRYFAFAGVELIVILSVMIAPLLVARPLVATLVLTSAAINLMYNSTVTAKDPRMDADAAMIAQVITQCPQTRVRAMAQPRPADTFLNRLYDLGLAQETVAVESMATNYKIKLLPAVADPTDETLACPVIYWAVVTPEEIDAFAQDNDTKRAFNTLAGLGIPADALLRSELLPAYSDMSTIMLIKPKT